MMMNTMMMAQVIVVLTVKVIMAAIVFKVMVLKQGVNCDYINLYLDPFLSLRITFW